MGKYNVGDKFIVEIKEVINSENGTLYRSNFKTLTFDDYGLDTLQKCEELSSDSKEMLEMKAYNKGLDDVWELVKKFYLNVEDGGLSHIDIGNIYRMSIDEILQHITPQEALAKLEAYEKKIEVGDVVRLKGSDKEYVVTTIDEDRCSEIYCGVSKDGAWFAQCNVEKTGKHIDIQSVLSQIAE